MLDRLLRLNCAIAFAARVKKSSATLTPYFLLTNSANHLETSLMSNPAIEIQLSALVYVHTLNYALLLHLLGKSAPLVWFGSPYSMCLQAVMSGSPDSASLQAEPSESPDFALLQAELSGSPDSVFLRPQESSNSWPLQELETASSTKRLLYSDRPNL